MEALLLLLTRFFESASCDSDWWSEKLLQRCHHCHLHRLSHSHLYRPLLQDQSKFSSHRQLWRNRKYSRHHHYSGKFSLLLEHFSIPEKFQAEKIRTEDNSANSWRRFLPSNSVLENAKKKQKNISSRRYRITKFRVELLGL